jgi:hypothetical protein
MNRMALITLVMTLALCAGGLAFGVQPIEVIGVLLFGLILTAVNSIRRKGSAE